MVEVAKKWNEKTELVPKSSFLHNMYKMLIDMKQAYLTKIQNEISC